MARVVCPGLLAALAGLLLPLPGAAQDAPPPSADPYKMVIVTAPFPYWGYVRRHPVADIIDAQGTYLIRKEKAAKLREENRRDKLKTREAELRHAKWEYNFVWDMRKEQRERAIKEEVDRAVKRAPMTEIIAGAALNTLLKDLSAKDLPSPSQSTPLEQEWLDNVNFTATGGNAGLLRQKELPWPALLEDERCAATRLRVETHLNQARDQVKAGRVSAKTLEELLRLKRKLDDDAGDLIRRRGTAWLPRHYHQATRFTAELNQALLLLENPKEARFLFGHRPASKTVAELIQDMSKDGGLKFGPASAGSERHYVALHAALAKEYRKIKELKDADK